jgi:hypothetical protein
MKQLSEQLLNCLLKSIVPYIVELAKYLANTIPIISNSLKFLFERFSKNTFVPIWQRNSAESSPVNSHQCTLTNSTEPLVSNSTFDDLFCGSGGEFNGYHTIYFKDVTSLFYYFGFQWGSCYFT